MSKKKQGSEHIAGFCPRCNAQSVFVVIGKHYPPGEWQEAEYEYENIFAHCKECKMPALLTRYVLFYEDNPVGSYTTKYPRTKEDARSLRLEVPKQIQTSYDEAVKCEKGKAWNACAVMVGRALEAACKDFDPKSRTINAGLKRMIDKGVISQEQFEWANELRLIRNIGAHPGNIIVEEVDASESLDFLQAILETIYHLRPMFEKMKQRRAKPEKA